jgi:demethylmenaquinone methyltransferase/2-methoxy-6-polyprenyl-1,4-benzoquinol methylase
VHPAITSRCSSESLPPAGRLIYDRLGGWYRWLSLPEAGPVRRAIRLLDPKADDQVLEIGPGSGRGLAELARRVGSRGLVVGIERSPEMLRLCASTLRKEGARRAVHLVLGDGRRIPIASERLSAVLLTFTLELFPDSDILDVLFECRRVVRHGGRLVVLSLSRSAKSGLIAAIYERGQSRFPQAIDCRFIAASEWIERAGWRVMASIPVSVWGLPAEIVLAENAARG